MKRIIERCKCGVFLTVNEHRDSYENVEKFLVDQRADDIPAEIVRKMIKRDTIMCLHFYPDTPVGFCEIYHYDYDELIKIALEILNKER